MALDGIAIAGIVHEFREKALGGRIDKVHQPEKDEVIVNIRSLGENLKFLLTAGSSNPRLHFTQQSKTNPMQAPLFCMVMRKHITGGKIVGVSQPGFERIVIIEIEAQNEMGDPATKKVVIEIMGKHSNVMLLDEGDIILDSVKHISHDQSSVREVLPGKAYVLPPSQGKKDPTMLVEQEFYQCLKDNTAAKAMEAVFKSYSGISPFIAGEICHQGGVDSDCLVSLLDKDAESRLFQSFYQLMERVKNNNFSFNIYSDSNKPVEFSAVEITQLDYLNKKTFTSGSDMLERYYSERDGVYRINQKTSDIKKVITTNIERCVKKKEMYTKTLNDIKNRDKLKLQGELITANIYSVEKGMTTFTTVNFYEESCPEITIAIDPNLSPSENAQKYFKKYNKGKRTFEALQGQIQQNDEELAYLETLLSALNTCEEESDVEEIREELSEQKYVKKKKIQKGMKPKKAKPLHFVSSDGFHIYVGKNNKQNDELTLKFAENNDMWFHTKTIPGSHVIVKAENKTIPDKTLEEAAVLAAFHSKGKNSTSVPVDYTIKKHVKKPSGAKPGMVIYDNYKTAYVNPDEELVKSLDRDK